MQTIAISTAVDSNTVKWSQKPDDNSISDLIKWTTIYFLISNYQVEQEAEEETEMADNPRIKIEECFDKKILWRMVLLARSYTGNCLPISLSEGQ